GGDGEPERALERGVPAERQAHDEAVERGRGDRHAEEEGEERERVGARAVVAPRAHEALGGAEGVGERGRGFGEGGGARGGPPQSANAGEKSAQEVPGRMRIGYDHRACFASWPGCWPPSRSAARSARPWRARRSRDG